MRHLVQKWTNFFLHNGSRFKTALSAKKGGSGIATLLSYQ